MLKRVRNITRYGITLIMIFDGASMPCKEGTEKKREKERNNNLQKAKAFEEIGNLAKARKYYCHAVDLTYEMVKEIIDELKKNQIECIVAPYEAEAQLVYLCKNGYISAVIAEDSDFVVFGAPKILYKMNNYGGQVKEFTLKDLWAHPDYDLSNWTQDQFMMMCVLSGCDYLKPLPGDNLKPFGCISLVIAYQYMRENPNLKELIKMLQRDSIEIPEYYEENFVKAIYSIK